MASVRPLLTTSAPQARSLAFVPSLSHTSARLASFNTESASLLKYRPLRQPQFSRLASTSSSQSSSPPSSSSSSSSSRSLHSSTTSRQAGGATLAHADASLLRPVKPGPDSPPPPTPQGLASKAPLSILPLRTVLRSLAVTTVSSSPLLLPPSLALMNVLAHTTQPLLNPDRNPLLKKIIKSTFYAQFCAGENADEVRATLARMKGLGFSGVLLGYAPEIVLTDREIEDLLKTGLQGEELEAWVRNEVVPWSKGVLETIRLAEEGDFVGLKFTGAGRQSLYTLSKRLPPPKALGDAIDEICTLAAARGVRLLFDAEQQAVQHGIDDWTLIYMRKYNRNASRKAVIYGTYQAYLKATPSVVAAHLHTARAEGFTLGVKLVRGAYLGSDPRHLIHDTKADTDACYNGIAEALLRREFSGPLAPYAKPPASASSPSSPSSSPAVFPEVNMVLASHNTETVRKARALLEEQGGRGGGSTDPATPIRGSLTTTTRTTTTTSTHAAGGPHRDNTKKGVTEIAFAQLQGMADEVSCEILAAKERGVFAPRVYKYVVWGSAGECMKYLLRRAHENRDAVQRTRSGRDAMRAELWRRVKGVFGLS